MSDKKTALRLAKNKVFKFIVVLFSLGSIIPLLFILLYIFKKGIGVINWKFLVGLPKPPGVTGGGIANAIVGTLMLILVASLFAIPLGVSGGVFLSEYRKSKLAYFTRLSVEILQGIPSIVIGIIAYLWVVKPMGKFSAFSGGIALGMIMLPMVVRSSEEVLKLVPRTLKEASLALGIPYHRTILRVAVPSALPGIVSGVLLGIARIAGETAPLLFTAFGNQFMNWNLFKPVNSLPLLIFNYAMSPYDEWQRAAWGASVILVIIVLLGNIISRMIVNKWKTRF